MVTAFLAPLLPFTIYIYRKTGNPIFPAANTFFKSPYWPTHGGWDTRFGPLKLWETVLWPVLIWFEPERQSELGVYSGRLSIGFVIAVVGLLFVWRNRRGAQRVPDSYREPAALELRGYREWSLRSLGNLGGPNDCRCGVRHNHKHIVAQVLLGDWCSLRRST